MTKTKRTTKGHKLSVIDTVLSPADGNWKRGLGWVCDCVQMEVKLTVYSSNSLIVHESQPWTPLIMLTRKHKYVLGPTISLRYYSKQT